MMQQEMTLTRWLFNPFVRIAGTTSLVVGLGAIGLGGLVAGGGRNPVRRTGRYALRGIRCAHRIALIAAWCSVSLLKSCHRESKILEGDVVVIRTRHAGLVFCYLISAAFTGMIDVWKAVPR